MKASPLLIAVGLMLINSIVIVMDAVIVRYLSADIHPFEILLFRNSFSLLAILPFLTRSELSLKGHGLWPVHFLRAAVKLIGLTAGFFAITMLPLSTFTAIAFTAPLFVTLGSVLFLGERLRWIRSGALLLGFIGVLIVLRPTEAPVGQGTFIAIGAAICVAIVVLLLKYSSVRDGSRRIVSINLFISVILGLILVIPFWTTPTPTQIAILAIQGLGGLLSQLAIARALKMADAAALAPIQFVQLPMAAALGYFLFSEQIELAVVAGGAIIVLSIVLLLSREKIIAQQRDNA
jgi:drug/metabolite transporter (DMT)-like permease